MTTVFLIEWSLLMNGFVLWILLCALKKHRLFKVLRASHRPLNYSFDCSIINYVFTNIRDSVIVIIWILSIRNSCQRPSCYVMLWILFFYHHCHHQDRRRHQCHQNQNHGPRNNHYLFLLKMKIDRDPPQTGRWAAPRGWQRRGGGWRRVRASWWSQMSDVRWSGTDWIL